MRKMLVAVLVIVGLSGPARADPVTEALFAEGIFDDLQAGHQIAYSHTRRGDTAPDFLPVTDGHIAIAAGQAADGTRSLSLTIKADGRLREIEDFSASGGNPVLMVFLESAVRSMATISGGSPFYIRNRIKDALRQGGDVTDAAQDFGGGTVAARTVTLYPFANDPNSDRMGAFAGLSLRFVISDAVPGRLLLLSADTPEPASGYHETITLTGVEAGQ
jgi:hypothetical protein